MWIQTDYQLTNSEFLYMIEQSGKSIIFHSSIPFIKSLGSMGGTETLTTHWDFETTEEADAAYAGLMTELNVRKKPTP